MKRTNYLGYILEYDRFEKLWAIIDWDFEGYENVIAYKRTKNDAMRFCEGY